MKKIEGLLQQVDEEVRSEITAAEIRGAVKALLHVLKRPPTYMEVARPLGMFSGGKELAVGLGRIMDQDAEAGRPLLCSGVVRRDTGLPGDGYFEHAANQHGMAIPSGPDGRLEFWARQIGQVAPFDELSDPQKKQLDELRSGEDGRTAAIVKGALGMFDNQRHVAFGVWADQLAAAVTKTLPSGEVVAVDEATDVLRRLAAIGATVENPSGLFVSTNGLLKYLDERKASGITDW